MTTQTRHDVPLDVYEEQYAGHFYEWVDGAIIKMSPVTDEHDDLTGIFREIFRAYFALKSIGRVKSAPFMMRYKIDDKDHRREPDLQVILGDNQQKLTNTYMDGAADICIEIVSAATSSVDYGDKFTEYEAIGVREYWLIDPLRKVSRFYRLDTHYQQILPDETGDYTTPLLPSFKLPMATLWQRPLPDYFAVAALVKAMMNS